jgi:hypothetical protein
MGRSPRRSRAERAGRRAAVAVATAAAAIACHLPPAGAVPLNKESSSMPPNLSRIPAPRVDPIDVDGVRYEQVRNGLLVGLDQMGGWLAAVDIASGQQLWVLKVYDNRRDPSLEGDAQDVFFRSMSRQPDGTLLIENERRRRFVVDPSRRSVAPAP